MVFSKDRIGRVLNSLKSKSDRLASNKAELEILVSKASRKAGRNKKALEQIWDELLVLFRLIRAWISGKYTQVSWKSLVLGVSALIYLVNPFDLIPDFLIGGLIDDVAVVGSVFGVLKSELDNFKLWEENQEKN